MATYIFSHHQIMWYRSEVAAAWGNLYHFLTFFFLPVFTLRNAFLIQHENRYRQCIAVFLLQAQTESAKVSSASFLLCNYTTTLSLEEDHSCDIWPKQTNQKTACQITFYLLQNFYCWTRISFLGFVVCFCLSIRVDIAGLSCLKNIISDC